MKNHIVRTRSSKENLLREDQLAWKIAGVAVDSVAVDDAVTDMVINRIIDNASVAIAAINRNPPAAARAQALAHPRDGGATVFGLPSDCRVDAEWAAWANGTAVRELDYHDTFLAADYAHPGDNIPPVLAVAQQMGKDGKALLAGIVTGYEIQINLVRAICLHEHKIDHIAHLGPSAAAGIGTLLGLPQEVIYQSVQQALHVTTTTRQSRKGEISSWKAFAPALAGKMAIEAASPIYEGEDGFIAWLLSGPDAEYSVPLPETGEPKRAILDSFTKEHSAEYQSQALIDLAFRMRQKIPDIPDTNVIEKIVIHTHESAIRIISKSGPLNNPADRDHCLQYMTAVPLAFGNLVAEHYEDGFHAANPIIDELREKMEIHENPTYTKEYLEPEKRSIANALQIYFKDGNSTKQVEINYPVGHRRRRKEGIPLLEDKFKSNLATRFPAKRCAEIFALCKDQKKLEQTPVNDFMDLFVI